MNRIMALVGMCGSGKSVCCQLFQDRGWEYVYFGGVTMAELGRQGLEKNEENERRVREGLRRELGPAAYAIKLLPVIREKLTRGNVCLDGLYSWSEYKVLKEAFGEQLLVVAILVPRSLRYQRIGARASRPLTPAQAQSRDVAEIENMEKGGPIAMADFFLVNDKSLAELEAETNRLIDEAERGASSF